MPEHPTPIRRSISFTPVQLFLALVNLFCGLVTLELVIFILRDAAFNNLPALLWDYRMIDLWSTWLIVGVVFEILIYLRQRFYPEDPDDPAAGPGPGPNGDDGNMPAFV